MDKISMENKVIIYSLRSENLTNLGGHMGDEYTFDNWIKYFSSIDDAKKYAEKDYKQQCESVGRTPEWFKKNHRTELQNIRWGNKAFSREPLPEGHICSQDLLFVMYHIEEVKIEEHG